MTPGIIYLSTNNVKAFKWFIECGLKIETEALISAAQDQALTTKHNQTQILRINQDSK